LLVNLLQNEYGVKDLLPQEQRVGLEAIMVPVKNLFTPPADQLIYDRAKECFVEVLENYVNGSADIIPGSDVTFRDVLQGVGKVPKEIGQTALTQPIKLDGEETAPEDGKSRPMPSIPPQEEQKHEEEEKTPDLSQQEPTLPEVEQQIAEPAPQKEEAPAEPSIEELVAQDVAKDMVKGKPDFHGGKEFVDEDGFVHVKPHKRNEYEHSYLRGRGRRQGKKGRNGETERYKVRGGKGPRGHRGRGRGGKIHHDKHDVDNSGRKVKTAHGKHPNWSKGEVRVQTPAE
jgi:hypothetical protein